MLEHLHHVVLNKFKSDLEQSLRSGVGFAASACYCVQSSMAKFDAGLRDSLVKHAEWDTTKVRSKLEHHIEAHARSVRGTKLAELKANYEKKLLDALAGPLQSILETGEKNSWACIRRLYRHATENAILAFSAALSEFELD